jgi:hypothetical protein
MTTDPDRLAALRKRQARLEVCARAVLEDARKYGDGDEAVVRTHLLRRLLRELDGEPQSSAFATMSAS